MPSGRTRHPRLAAALLALAAAAPAWAQPRVAAEAELKAAFVYRIALFVEWPAEPFGNAVPFQVCVLGPDAGWSAAFVSLEGKKVQGRPVVAPRSLARADEARGCQVVVLADGDTKRAAALPPAVLTVGDADGFAQGGGMVGFVREGSQLRFDINREAAARAQLRLPAELLKVARAVVDGGSARP